MRLPEREWVGWQALKYPTRPKTNLLSIRTIVFTIGHIYKSVHKLAGEHLGSIWGANHQR